MQSDTRDKVQRGMANVSYEAEEEVEIVSNEHGHEGKLTWRDIYRHMNYEMTLFSMEIHLLPFEANFTSINCL